MNINKFCSAAVLALAATMPAACDSGELTRSQAKSILNKELAGDDFAYLIVCLTGDLYMAASNAEQRLCIDANLVWQRLAIENKRRAPRNKEIAGEITPYFDKMFVHLFHDIMSGTLPYATYYLDKETLSSGPAVVKVEELGDRFVGLKLKNFSFTVGEIEGIRDADEFEHNCDKKVDFRYARTDKAPWADAWIERNRLDRTYSECLVKYDDGWRLGGE